MRRSHLVLGAMFVAAASGVASAQEPARGMTPLETAVGCAPPPTFDVPRAQFHVIGAQDVVARTEYADRDVVVVDGGTDGGLQVGQQFFVRRPNRFGTTSRAARQGVRTVGWVRIVAVNDSTAMARFEHLCGAVAINDFLEPFVAPVVPAGADRDETPGAPDFDSMARVVSGNEGRSEMGSGDFALIDHGSEQGVRPGVRVALFRDVRADGMPLAQVGEAVVITTSEKMAVARITRAVGPITTGDYAATRK